MTGKETFHLPPASKAWLKVILMSLDFPFLGPDAEGCVITGCDSLLLYNSYHIYCVVASNCVIIKIQNPALFTSMSPCHVLFFNTHPYCVQWCPALPRDKRSRLQSPSTEHGVLSFLLPCLPCPTVKKDRGCGNETQETKGFRDEGLDF